MIKHIIKITLLAFALSQNAFAATGNLFAIQESGPALDTPATITICANIKGPISCQKYTVQHEILSITTTTHQAYPFSGIKVDTGTFKLLDCTSTTNGYCALPLNNQTPVDTAITTVAVMLQATDSIHTEVGIAYDQENIATGGTKPYTFSISSGTLPAGTSLNSSTGAVSGTPTTLGAFDYSIQVTDANFSTAIATTSGTINSALSTSAPSNTTVDAGQTASFSTTTSNGTMPYMYQWQVNTGGGYTNVSTGSGGASASYTTGTLTTAASGYTYQVIVTDSAAVPTSVTSSAATVTVNAALSTSTPSNQTVSLGTSSTATFSTITSNGTSPYSYQWQVNTGSGYTNVSTGTGGTTTSYTTGTLGLSDNGNLYQVIVTDSAAVPTSVISGSATVTVTTLRALDDLSLTGSSAETLSSNNHESNNSKKSTPIVNLEHITAMSCPRDSFCMAVTKDGATYRFDGTQWNRGDTIDTKSVLKSVACSSASHCIAIDTGGYAYVYHETWSPGTQFDTTGEPISVSCPTASFCMAIDNHANAYTYDNTSWSAAESVGIFGDLQAVSCTNDSECFTIDGQGNSSRYDGHTWTPYQENPISPEGLRAISCTSNSGSFCMAVDNIGNTFSYNGSSWTPQNERQNAITISCLSTTFCIASDDKGGALHYNGTSWNVAGSIDAEHNIVSISCPTTKFCMGLDSDGNTRQYHANVASITQAYIRDGSMPSMVQTLSIDADSTATSHNLAGIQPESVYIDNNNNLWIADRKNGTVYRLPANIHGQLKDNLPSLVSISLSTSQPVSVVTDAKSNIYVADHNNAIFIYPAAIYQVPGRYTNPSSSRIINGKHSGLNAPSALALDNDDNIWVTNRGAHSIEQFAAGMTSTDTKPMLTISGNRTLLNEPNSLFIDKQGNVWVTNANSHEIHVYAAGISGNSAPSCIIRSDAIKNPTGIALDAQGNIYQANDLTTDGNINVFEPIAATCGITMASPIKNIASMNAFIGQSFGLAMGYVF